MYSHSMILHRWFPNMSFSEIPSGYFCYSARVIPKFRPAVVLQQEYFPQEHLQHKLDIKTMLTKYFLGGHERYVKKPMDNRGVFLRRKNNRRLRIYVSYSFTNPPFKEKEWKKPPIIGCHSGWLLSGFCCSN